MPTVFRHKGYRFFFYSNEGDPTEPLHIHVIKGECVAKSYKMKSPELAMLSKVVKERSDLIREVWNEYFD